MVHKHACRDVHGHTLQEECQMSKRPRPTQAPLVNAPIGRLWQMGAIDILEVLLSNNNNQYTCIMKHEGHRPAASVTGLAR